MNKVKYSTKQRRMLLDFLAAHPDEAFSASQIADCLSGDGISKSAVYRNIDMLVREGALQKSAEKGSRRFLYRYVNCEQCTSHLHMKCIECGCIYHMDDEETGRILSAVALGSSFKIDEKKTVLYGMCVKCT